MSKALCQPLLRKGLAEVERRIRAAGRLALFADFDGTLTSIVPDPAQAKLDPPTRETLLRISRRHDISTTIISGRALNDLRARIGIDGLVYAGNHGLEISGKQMHFVEPVAAARREQLREISESLAARLWHIDGAFVEYKGLSTSVHYRRVVAEADVEEIEKIVSTLLSQSALFRLSSGNKVFEIIPRTNWHKGAAVCWINDRLGDATALSVYIGDDRTDEDAFRMLPEAITVKVGDIAETAARYHLAGPREVDEFLFWLSRSRPNT
jgi:trehalose 6-phosphate phosphatase